ncbi:MAG: type II secretion system protein GspN [Myxococcales bacterium FL481]|nr:MAG: type II secretion system protein GspN [Myxococcales bacterium FL481]
MARRFRFPWSRDKDAPGAGSGLGLRALGRYSAFFTGGVVAFVVLLWLNLPERALAWRLADEAKRRGYLVTIGELDISPWGAVTLRDVTWSFAPSRSDQITVPFVVDELEITPSWFSLIAGDIQVDVDAELDEGRFSASVDWREDAADIKLDIDRVPLYSVPRLQQSVNAPVSGTFSSHVELTAPERQFERANGVINLVCAGCTVGDGEELVYIPGAKGWLAKGITLPELKLGELNGQLTVTDGVAQAEEFQAESEDLTLVVGGKIQFNDPVQRSRFDIEIKLLVNERLQEENDSVRLLLSTASKDSRLEAPLEGWLGFRLQGSAARPRFRGINAKTREDRVREAREKRREREAARRKRQAERQKQRAERAKPKADPSGQAVKSPPSRGGPPSKPADPDAAREREREVLERRRDAERRAEEEEDERRRAQKAREEQASQEREQAAREAEEPEADEPAKAGGQAVNDEGGEDDDENPADPDGDKPAASGEDGDGEEDDGSEQEGDEDGDAAEPGASGSSASQGEDEEGKGDEE